MNDPIPAPGSGGLLRVFQGVSKGVLDGIEHGDIAEVEASQDRVASALSEYGDRNYSLSGDVERSTSAVSPEGAILSLTLVDGPVAGS